MELESRLAEVERRLARLEATLADGGPPQVAGSAGVEPRETFWALEGLKAMLAEHTTGGGVLFTGAVRLPTGQQFEWQFAQLTEALLAWDWSDAADSFAALGHPVRLRLLHEILTGRRTVVELTALDGLGTSGQVYHHLRQLTAAGWLQAEGRGRYEVPGARVVALLVALTLARP